MIIEIDDDCLSEIIKGVLVKDYIYITRDLKSPKNWHEEDIQAFKEASEAIKKLGRKSLPLFAIHPATLKNQ